MSRNNELKKTLSSMDVIEDKKLKPINKKIPKPNAKNTQGFEAYSLDNWFKLISKLGTLKVQSQFYKTELEQVKELRELVQICAKEDPLLVAKAIVYSRCIGEMRTINHFAAVFLAPYVSGKEWARRFYGPWDRKNQKGGVIYRLDDMSEIIIAYKIFNKKSIPNSMKKGFAKVLETSNSLLLGKYKKQVVDVMNLVHPKENNSKSFVKISNGENVKTFKAIINNLAFDVDTWERQNSDAGQIVAQAVRENKISKDDAKSILSEQKSSNFLGLLNDNKIGILAALRNIRSILLNNPKKESLDLLCKLFENSDQILKGKIMPYQIDLALEITKDEFSSNDSRRIIRSLEKGYESSVPNLQDILTGNNLVILDCSGSMQNAKINCKGIDGLNKQNFKSSCLDKASLMAATICKATNADIIRFGDYAEYVNYNPVNSVFDIAKTFSKSMGWTDLSKAWTLASSKNKKYDRVFILSDNECNRGSNYKAYSSYVSKIGDPYVYSIDLASYGTTSIAGPKVKYFYGYGFRVFEDIVASEFNPQHHLDKIRNIII